MYSNITDSISALAQINMSIQILYENSLMHSTLGCAFVCSTQCYEHTVSLTTVVSQVSAHRHSTTTATIMIVIATQSQLLLSSAPVSY